MAIDFAGDLEAIVDAGDRPSVTGTLTQDGTDYPFTRGLIVRRHRSPAGGNKDIEEIDLLLVNSGITATPRGGARLVLTGDATSWLVTSAAPHAPGGTVTSWNLRLIDYTATTP